MFKKRIAGLLCAALMGISAIAMTACSKDDPPTPVVKSVEEIRADHLANADKNAKLQDLLENQRSIAAENATKNASTYFAANPRFDASWSKIPHTDDQITSACPQGSGWAWVNIMKVEGKDVDKKTIWCSTSSRSLGCYIESDFVKGPNAGQARTCNADLPYPLKAFK